MVVACSWLVRGLLANHPSDVLLDVVAVRDLIHRARAVVVVVVVVRERLREGNADVVVLVFWCECECACWCWCWCGYSNGLGAVDHINRPGAADRDALVLGAWVDERAHGVAHAWVVGSGGGGGGG